MSPNDPAETGPPAKPFGSPAEPAPPVKPAGDLDEPEPPIERTLFLSPWPTNLDCVAILGLEPGRFTGLLRAALLWCAAPFRAPCPIAYAI
jgi:hypothetical protein